MNYYWLNQRSPDRSAYDDDVGRLYHYRGSNPGAKQLEKGNLIVYYKPGDHLLLGAGQVSEIEVSDSEGKLNATTDCYAHIRNYVPFEPAIILKGLGESNLKNEISFLKDREGLRGVPQHSIHQINKEDYELILDTAGVSIDKVIEDGSNT